MISPELLRRYPFFGTLDADDLEAIAMLADEESIPKGIKIFEEGGEAIKLYLLMEGSVELYYHSQKIFNPNTRKDFYIGDINPGEVFSISSMIEPYTLTATAVAAQTCRVIKIDAVTLRQMFDEDPLLGYRIMLQTTKAAYERLAAVRAQLAAAWA